MRGAHFVGTQIPLSCHLIEVRQVLPPSLIDFRKPRANTSNVLKPELHLLGTSVKITESPRAAPAADARIETWNLQD
jgi:hypothetical protein